MPHALARLLAHLTGALLAAAAAGAAAQAWPAKTVRVIVPFPAGGSTDILGRILARQFAAEFAQPFIVDNRAGANGNIGAAAVATAAPDGYTLMFCTTGPLVFNKFMYKTTPFDPANAFTPIAKVAEIPLVIAAHPSLPAKSFAELVALAKSRPGALTYASPGNGSMGHLTAELVQRHAGVTLMHVPYKGSAPAQADLMSGVVDLSFDLAPTYAPQVKSGTLRAIAVTTSRRTPILADTPTLAESGLREVEATGWSALVAPAGLAPDIVAKLNASVNRWLASAEGKAELAKLGMDATGGTAAELRDYMAAQVGVWQPVVSSVPAQ